MLEKHELLRVRTAGSSGLEAEFVQFVMTNMLDAVVVMRQGNTLTLYRESGLQRPSVGRGSEQDDSGIVA